MNLKRFMTRVAFRTDARLRFYYTIVVLGFAMSSFASFNGSGPNWPNREIIGFIAALASISVFLYCFFWSDFWRRIAVSATVIAASGRAVGWLATVHVDIYFRIGATGSLISIAALILIVNTAARRGL